MREVKLKGERGHFRTDPINQAPFGDYSSFLLTLQDRWALRVSVVRPVEFQAVQPCGFADRGASGGWEINICE